MRLSRRDFLAASVAAMAVPGAARAAAVALPKDAEIIVVGAGAAGIAAARRVLAAGRKVVVVEAADRIGGRCWTDTATFGVPFDRGARWLYAQNANPVARLARTVAMDVYAAPQAQKIRIGRRNARAGETEDFLATLVRTNRALGDPNRKADAAALEAMPKDTGEWARTLEFALGPATAGKDLKDVSALDSVAAGPARFRRFLPAGPRCADREAFRDGSGCALPACDSHRLGRAGRSGGNRVRTCHGTRAVIVTVSTSVLIIGARSSSRRTCRNVISMPPRELCSAATITLRSSFRTIRSVCSATTS